MQSEDYETWFQGIDGPQEASNNTIDLDVLAQGGTGKESPDHIVNGMKVVCKKGRTYCPHLDDVHKNSNTDDDLSGRRSIRLRVQERVR